MNKPLLLWLVWQNVETRQRYHVGNLIYQDDLFMYQYEQSEKNRNLTAALENGYHPHLAFPDLKTTYTSDFLFGPFAKRLPNKSRPDFKKMLTKFSLKEDYTEMEFLSATGGKLATDSYEFVNPIYVKDNKFTLDFHIAGWNYYDGDTILNQLEVGSDLILEDEPDNDKDEFAIKILDSNNTLLGYVPAFYSEAFSEAVIFSTTIVNIDNDAIPQLRVKVRVEGSIEEDSSYQKNIRRSNNLLPVYYQI